MADKGLLPCPFCGGAADFDAYIEGDKILHFVFCSEVCGVATPGEILLSDAVAVWQNRVPVSDAVMA